MRVWLYLALLLLFNSCATAQRSTASSYSKKEQRKLTEARAAIDAENFGRADKLLLELLEDNPADAQLQFLRSVALRGEHKYGEAAGAVRLGIAQSERPGARPYRELGELLSLSGDFAGAKAAYQTYYDRVQASSNRPERLAEAKDLLRRATIADSLAANPVDFSPTPVPGAINTTDFEYHPTISVDGKQLIFTRRVNRQQEDFYVSQLGQDGTWLPATPLSGINTPYDEGAQTVTADGSYMIYTSCNSPTRQPGCDLYESFWDGNRWSPGRPIADEGINTQHYEAQPTLSPEGRYLLFTSKRPGGKGGADIYISGRMTSGGWSKPIQLVTLNTSGDEQYPFWAADNQTVYFTSNGHPGLGGDDVFVTRLTPDNDFTEPRNLGYPINTAENETNMFIPLNGDVAYYSRRYYDLAEQRLQIDLYQFPLPRHLRPRKTTFIRARVTDRDTDQPLTANVSIQNIETDLLAYRQRTNEAGEFLTTLPVGAEYAFVVDKEGYLFASERLVVDTTATADNPLVVDIKLEPISEALTESTGEKDGATAFENVLFATGSAELLRVSITELRRLSAILKGRPDLSVTIAGHTDNVGGEAANQDLSQRRAESVKAFLVSEGITAARISTVGYGEARPVADNDTATGRARNRRTTFKLSAGR